MKVVSPQQWQPLQRYVAWMHHMIDEWETFLLKRSIDWISPALVSDWLQRLRSSFDIIEGTYLYDDLDSVSIETESTGFPKRRHFDLLVHKKQDDDCEVGNLFQVKSQFLDSLFANHRVNIESLEKVAKAKAMARLASDDIHRPFRLIDVTERESPTDGRRAFVCVWERFISQPMLYIMLFEAESNWIPAGDSLDDLVQHIQHATALKQALNAVARQIDISDARIHPKWVGRVVLGPAWITGLTTGDHILQHAVDQVDDDMHYCASRIVYEYVFSDGETEVSHIRDTNGEQHARVQSYVVHPKRTHYIRGAAFTEETFFMPHEIIQNLDDMQHVTMGHQLITIERRDIE